jgi:hypothetical protein
MEIVKADKSQIDAIWPIIEDWVDTARGEDNSFSVADIKALCKTRMDLWLAKDADTIKGFLIGSTSVRPQGNVYHASWLGGEDLALWVNGMKVIEDWAKQAGYLGCSFIGRKAWKKLVGYDYDAVYYFKKLR